MPHHTPLIAAIATGFVLAFIFGALANRLRLSPLVGYLLAGVMVGPFTPGFVADKDLSHELSEIGVILLMFGVGLHFSLKDLLAVKNIAIPGALGGFASINSAAFYGQLLQPSWAPPAWLFGPSRGPQRRLCLKPSTGACWRPPTGPLTGPRMQAARAWRETSERQPYVSCFRARFRFRPKS